MRGFFCWAVAIAGPSVTDQVGTLRQELNTRLLQARAGADLAWLRDREQSALSRLKKDRNRLTVGEVVLIEAAISGMTTDRKTTYPVLKKGDETFFAGKSDEDMAIRQLARELGYEFFLKGSGDRIRLSPVIVNTDFLAVKGADFTWYQLPVSELPVALKLGKRVVSKWPYLMTRGLWIQHFTCLGMYMTGGPPEDGLEALRLGRLLEPRLDANFKKILGGNVKAIREKLQKDPRFKGKLP